MLHQQNWFHFKHVITARTTHNYYIMDLGIDGKDTSVTLSASQFATVKPIISATTIAFNLLT